LDHFEDDLRDDDYDTDEESASLADEAGQLPWLTDEEFVQKYRVSRESFGRIVQLIENHPVFNPSSKGRKQSPVAHQLMVFLKYVGTEGSGASNANQRHTFAIGYGTSPKFRRRVTQAILSLRHTFIRWPNSEERKRIGKEVNLKYGFPHCVGIADGTLFPLAFEPQTVDAPDYSGRKYGYSLTTMIICDHNKRIRDYLSGYPGSAHDNRVFKNTSLKKLPPSHFDVQQYIVGDSVFENDWFMVSGFKKLANSLLEEDQEMFNTKLSKLRILSEHCIGMLKGRFPWLRQIRLVITEDKRSLVRILQLIDATIILHNMLIDFGEEDVEAWIDYDDFSDLDDAQRAPYEDGDELNTEIPNWMPKDTRRTRLLHYFKEFFFLDV
jgi:DDE superfamily endonuclease